MKKGSVNPHLYKARVGSCVVCGGEYRATGDYGERKQKYCSRECWSKRSPKITVKCRNCNEDFDKYKSVRKTYCCKECKIEDYKKRFKGENASRWGGGKTSENKKIRSSSDFKRWRELVYERDDYQCVLCDENRDLHPHHIIHLANDNEKALIVNNGATLCSTCHSIIHGRIIGGGDKLLFSDKKHSDLMTAKWAVFTNMESA